VINIELYADKNTFIHRVHPTAKIVSLILIFAQFLVFNAPLFILPEFVFLFVLVIISGTAKNIMKMWWVILAFAIMSFLLWSIFIKEGAKVVEFAGISVTENGLMYSASAVMRLTGMLLAGMVLIYTTRIEEIGYGLKNLGVPFRIAFSLMAAVRLLPVFLGAGAGIVDAQESRGLDLRGGSVIRRLRNYIPLLIPSFLYGMRNVTQLTIALEARGFSSAHKRTSYLEIKIKPSDFIIMFSLAGIFLLSVSMRILGMGRL